MRRSILIAIIVVCSILLAGIVSASFLLQRNLSSTPPNPSPQVSHKGQHCGVRKNVDGTYTFSWLHVASDGNIVDEQNCIVPLVGFNIGGLFLGSAGAGTTPLAGTNPVLLNWIHQTFPANVMRVSFNTIWWNQDVLVPKAGIHYRLYFQAFVKNLEQSGYYVQLDPTTNFTEPPCGGVITHCPPQDQGEQDFKASPSAATRQESPFYIPPIVQAWQSMIPLYANDPAILYDAWNEPVVSKPSYFQEMNKLIDTVQALNPRALVFVFANQWPKIMKGKRADYTQHNLVIDFHMYDGFHGASPINGKTCDEPGKYNYNPYDHFPRIATFIHQHGQAIIFNEWGGCYDLPAYHQHMIAFAQAYNISLVYFQVGNCMDYKNGSYEVNTNGKLVQAGYASILGG